MNRPEPAAGVAADEDKIPPDWVFSRDRPEDRLGVKLLRGGDRIMARGYHQAAVLRPCPIPRDGPAILICNHTSSIDPVYLQSACPNRLITWMMAREYLDVPYMKWFFRTVGIIPVARSGRDSGPLRMALRALEAGRVLGIFPEGRISPTRELLPFQTGVALMAIKTGVPVFPAYLDGTQRGREMVEACLSRNQGIMTFGPAVALDRSDNSRPAWRPPLPPCGRPSKPCGTAFSPASARIPRRASRNALAS